MRQIWILVALLFLSPAVHAQDSIKGRWEALSVRAPTLPVHAALLHTGKVLLVTGSGYDSQYTHGLRSAVFDPRRQSITDVPLSVDLFCGGQAFLPDGTLLMAGGTDHYGPITGHHKTLRFDPRTERWARVDNMAWARWYPTLVALGTGSILAVADQLPTENEIYTRGQGWRVSSSLFSWPEYPALHLLADGRVFHSGMRADKPSKVIIRPGFVTPTTGRMQSLPASALPTGFDLTTRNYGASVLLPPAQDQQVMVIGGGDPVATASVYVIDTDAAHPAYVAAQPLQRARSSVNAVLLPDRTVLAVGGSRRWNDPATAIYEAEIFQPASRTWTTGARAHVPRLYHSVAVLLPDGRVLTAGGNPHVRTDELRLEVYSPPYLFRGPRPRLTVLPTTLPRGKAFTVHTAQAVRIRWLHLVRPMATTHFQDSEQRLVDVPFTRGRDALQARIPTNPNLVPSGWYMLFVVSNRGVPSVAHWIHVP